MFFHVLWWPECCNYSAGILSPLRRPLWAKMELCQLINCFFGLCKIVWEWFCGAMFSQVYLNLESHVRHFSHTDCIKIIIECHKCVSLSVLKAEHLVGFIFNPAISTSKELTLFLIYFYSFIRALVFHVWKMYFSLWSGKNVKLYLRNMFVMCVPYNLSLVLQSLAFHSFDTHVGF